MRKQKGFSLIELMMWSRLSYIAACHPDLSAPALRPMILPQRLASVRLSTKSYLHHNLPWHWLCNLGLLGGAATPCVLA